ncbi:MAG TPA: hypothetical protein VJ987_13275 [Anaerolineales bacterium]|nr:hypothetical protein [Anaerolineales bacterium]
MEEVTTPLYLNWSFWAVIVAAIAVLLSQLPPIHVWFRKAKLDIELYSKISITHKVGNPNLQIHLIINNAGGRKVRIKDISASITRDRNLVTTLPAQNYLQNQNDKSTLLFTTFSLKPNEEWAHIVNLLNFFNRDDENEYRRLENSMLEDAREKRAAMAEEPKSPIELDNALVQPCNEFFNRHFIWNAGEFQLTVNVTTDQKKANISKTYRFTVFESHTGQLKAITEQYKFGGGIWWDPNIPVSVILDIQEA